MTTHSQVKHLFYEVQMFGETFKKLEAPEFADGTTFNALIESFCIHARNLNEFFLERSNHGDTLKASSFTDAAYRRPRKTKARAALFGKINQQIARLTVRRTAMTRRKIGTKQMREMYKLLYADLRNFDRHLRPALRRKWKVAFS